MKNRTKRKIKGVLFDMAHLTTLPLLATAFVFSDSIIFKATMSMLAAGTFIMYWFMLYVGTKLDRDHELYKHSRQYRSLTYNTKRLLISTNGVQFMLLHSIGIAFLAGYYDHYFVFGMAIIYVYIYYTLLRQPMKICNEVSKDEVERLLHTFDFFRMKILHEYDKGLAANRSKPTNPPRER